MNELSNKNIFKNIVPFLAIFVVSFAYAGFHYIQDIAGGASASDNYDIQIRAVDTPLTTINEWKWTVLVFNKKPNPSDQLKYSVRWCSETQNKYGQIPIGLCKDEKKIKFNTEITSGNLSSDAKEVLHNIKHQSVDCGSIELEVSEGPELLATTIIDTGDTCAKSGTGNGLLGFSGEDNAALDALTSMYCNFHKCEGKSEEDPDNGSGQPPPSSDPGGEQPGSTLPQPPKPGAKFVLSCPINNSAFVGSLWTKVGGYGHCDQKYNSFPALYDNCRGGRDVIWGTAFGIDIHGNYGENIFLPTIDGQTVQWYHYDVTPSKVNPGQAIHRYTTTFGGEKISLQYHHSQVDSQPPVKTTIPSGSIGTLVCKNCSLTPSHVHVQLKFGSTVTGSNAQGWVDAGKYFQCPGL
jgi:hypothetical protein